MPNIALKMKYSAISALVFFIVANPELYKFTDLVFGLGTNTFGGLLLHTVVFFLIMLALMMVPTTA